MMANQQTSLSCLLEGLYPVPRQLDCNISDITLDSREVTSGSCFLSLSSNVKEATSRMKDSCIRGASAILTGKDIVYGSSDVPVFVVRDLGCKVGDIANRFFKSPSSDLRVCAVTGTTGKTTVAYLTSRAVRFLEGKCGYIGTLGTGEVIDLMDTKNTTPDVISINRLLSNFRELGISCTNIEASSHGITQRRLQAIQFHSLAFTNLGHDHLDYHGTITKYNNSKRRLFEDSKHEHVILNADDGYSVDVRKIVNDTKPLWVCSSKETYLSESINNLIFAKNIQIRQHVTAFDLVWNHLSGRINSPLLGGFNIDNLLMVAATLLSLGYEFDNVVECLGMLDSVPGRMEFLGRTDTGGAVYLDYAHTPESLSAVLMAMKELNPTRICLVFGCGGDRDKTKRIKMGVVAEQYADRVFVTSDNPRFEDEMTIVSDIMADVTQSDKFEIELNRKTAIFEAISSSRENEYVVIAGKGHEITQSKNGVEYPLCDRTIVTSILSREVDL